MMLDCIKWYWILIYARPIILSLIFIISMQTTTSDACTTNSLQFSPKSNCDSKLACWGFQTSNAVTRRPTSNFVSNNVPNFISENCTEDIASVLSTIEVGILHCIGNPSLCNSNSRPSLCYSNSWLSLYDRRNTLEW